MLLWSNTGVLLESNTQIKAVNHAMIRVSIVYHDIFHTQVLPHHVPKNKCWFDKHLFCCFGATPGHIRLNVFRTSQRYFYMKRNYFSWLAYTPYVPYYMIMLLLRNTSNTFSMISNVRDRISDNTQDMSKKAWHQLESCQKWKNEKSAMNILFLIITMWYLEGT